ncbi:MAG: hypothetical protein JXA75_04595 [Candidatus Thermoplasmatota archaeon]|nr:hypothetical protein [Candidatus Thermoplasmatota archaeon]
MRKQLLMGSLFAAVLLLFTPMVSAVEWRTVQTELRALNIQEPRLQEILPSDDQGPQPTCIILLTVLILLIKFIRFTMQHFRQIVLGIIVLILIKMLGG